MPLLGRRILVVEDEALIALDLAEALQELHAIVVGPVNNVAAARQIISEQQIDCAVLDVQLFDENVSTLMPDLDSRRIPRVFMTAFAHEDLPKEWKAWPALHKPMAVGDLLRAIERVVARP